MPRYAVRTQRPRLVRAASAYGTWGPGGKPPCASGTYPTREAGTRSPYVPYGGPGAYASALVSDGVCASLHVHSRTWVGVRAGARARARVRVGVRVRVSALAHHLLHLAVRIHLVGLGLGLELGLGLGHEAEHPRAEEQGTLFLSSRMLRFMFPEETLDWYTWRIASMVAASARLLLPLGSQRCEERAVCLARGGV